MRHLQTFGKRQSGENLVFSALEDILDYKQRKKSIQKKRAAAAAAALSVKG
jgi:hypothetical protein